MGQINSKRKVNCPYSLLVYQDEEPFIQPRRRCSRGHGPHPGRDSNEEEEKIIFTCTYHDEIKRRFIEVYIYSDGNVFYDITESTTQGHRKVKVSTKWKNKFFMFMLDDLDRRGINIPYF